MTPAITSTAEVPTPSASRYLQQLCKHWSHNLEVNFDAQRGRVVFPRDARGAAWAGEAVVTFVALPDTLACTITASEPDQLEGVKAAVARHLDRFAFREAPLRFDWNDG